MFNHKVTVNEFISSLGVHTVEVQQSTPVSALRSTAHDLCSYDAPVVCLYKGDRWSVFSLTFFDFSNALKSNDYRSRFSSSLKSADGKVVHAGFANPSDINFFEFPEGLYGEKTKLENKLRYLSGMGRIYDAHNRIAVVEYFANLSYHVRKFFKSYFWVRFFRDLSSKKNMPKSLSRRFKKWGEQIQNKHDARMDDLMYRPQETNPVKYWFFRMGLKTKISYYNFRGLMKVYFMRLMFPRLLFLKLYYMAGWARVEKQIWSFIKSNPQVENVLDEEYSYMSKRSKRKQYPVKLYRYILVLGLNADNVAACYSTFGEEYFNKMTKMLASGMTAEECISKNIIDMPDEWLESLMK